MLKPVNKKTQARHTIYAGAVAGVGIIYLSLHIGKCWDGTAEGIDAVMIHALTRPFDVFPINTQYAGIGVLAALIAMLLIYQHFLSNRNLRPDEESGSASWNEDLKKYYKKYADVTKATTKINEDTGGNHTWTYTSDEKGNRIYKHQGTKNMILSQDVVLSMDTRKTRRNNNILVIGGSGTGKSRYVMKPNMLQANTSFVITDPSGELLESMGSFLQTKGYEIKVFNLVQMDHSNCYNPFHYIRNEEGVLTMINALIENTTPKGSTPTDPFWVKAETALLQAICFYLIAECAPEEQNFNSVMKLLRCVEAGEGSDKKKSVLDVLMDNLRKKDPEHIALQSYAVFKSAGGGKTAQSILISCQTRLQMFNLSAIKNLTNTDDIDLKSIGDKPTALFCITSVVDTTYNFLVALMYTQLFETLYFHAETECSDIYHQGIRLPIHVRFLLDEFPNIGTIPEFAQKLATMRKYEISCTIVVQALSQLKSMYKDDWEVLIGNCDTQLFLGGSDATTLEYISKKLGKETIRAKNTSRNFGRSGGSSTSLNQTGRELLQPDELARMHNDNCIVFLRGVLPFFSTKYDYPKHPNYHMTGDADKKYLFRVKSLVQTAAGKKMETLTNLEASTNEFNQNQSQKLKLRSQPHTSARHNPMSEFDTEDDMESLMD